MLVADVGNFLTDFSEDVGKLSSGVFEFVDVGFDIATNVKERISSVKDDFSSAVPENQTIKTGSGFKDFFNKENKDQFLIWGAVGVLAIAGIITVSRS